MIADNVGAACGRPTRAGRGMRREAASAADFTSFSSMPEKYLPKIAVIFLGKSFRR